MTKTQATDIHATQQGAPLCMHLTRELEYLTLSDEGERRRGTWPWLSRRGATASPGRDQYGHEQP